MALTDPRPAQHDDTDYDDTPPGNIWRPGAEPGQPSGREAAAGRPGGSRRLSFLP